MPVKKICNKCGEEKPLKQFYKNFHMKDGHLNTCIECVRNDNTIRKESKINADRINSRFFGICESRGLDKEQKRKMDLQLEIEGRKLRKKLGVQAPWNWTYVNDMYDGRYGGVV